VKDLGGDMSASGGVQASDGTPLDELSARASIARVYDAALGGSDNFEIDRQVLAQVRQVAPEVNDLAWSNRKFLARAVRFLADQAGIRQFLDCGSGLPTAENTHQIARRVSRATRVVYVDNDPAVIAHSEALLAGDELSSIVAADIFEPAQVLDHDTVRDHLDFSRPIAVLQVAPCTTTSGTTAPI
jgi:S-adenosyl methyltransferase